MVKFLHIADTHLGYKQYNLQTRYNDFIQAFQFILNKAIDERVDFVLIAGDMFNDSKVNPETLSKVYQILSQYQDTTKLKLKKDIPILAIEGNHDSPIFSSQSWMKFLADLGLIHLLSGDYNTTSKTVTFTPYSPETNRGGFIELEGVRIYGLPYFGSNTPLLFPAIYEAIQESDDYFTILMMHFGIAGRDKKKAGINYTPELEKLHKKVNYLALGHFHTMYTFPMEDEWIYNPGSSEINDIKEYDVNRDHGAFLIEINASDTKNFEVTKILCENGDSQSKNLIPNRTFYSPTPMNVGASKATSFKETLQEVIKNLKAFGFKSRKNEDNINKSDNLNYPILVLTLFGTVPYSRLEFNTRQLREHILEELDILDARIYSTSIQSELDGIIIEGDEELSIDEIEKKVFEFMIDSNKNYTPARTDLLNLIFDIKAQLQEIDADPKFLKDHIKQWYSSHISELKGKEGKKIKEKKIQNTENDANLDDMDDLLGDLTEYEDSGEEEFDFEL
ncbi:hypothetical protein NEF87_000945 [Candidatus Lokiarchaeum ossiferum]|uniref:Calcineurin-like phosphoesterase domain-containing protein n=1 Tax=Candidatus Lokiarchaeum ossiferum TaxID=2951803 RepID=A0ABY6HMP0_9ARCH|nr:hypothetical protein NEF87_000945 [Candidatus Lokiarchaeum sp. B-35]